jgi:hypothetical protein
VRLWGRGGARGLRLARPSPGGAGAAGIGARPPARAALHPTSYPRVRPVRPAALPPPPGGLDELHYWADHAFMPSLWAPYCSDAPRDVTVVGLLKVPREGDARGC